MMKEKRMQFKKLGFTMVEVIIVVAVIAILASIIIPKMSGSRNKANLAACKTNLRHIAIAIQMYANDNQGWETTVTSGSPTYVYCNNYLVPNGYLRSEPYCPAGHGYVIHANSNLTGWPGVKNGDTVIYSANYFAGVTNPHPDIQASGQNLPYMVKGQVHDHW